MNAVERFIAGEDKLSAVLGAAPFFDAPETLASWMSQTARAVENERAAKRDAIAAGMFEPPARLCDAVLREAWALERAQAPRRQALRAELARGTGIEAALGAPVSPKAAAWLHGWARQEKAPRAAPHSAPTRRRAWWKPGLIFGASFSIALLAGLSVQFHWLASPETPPAPMLAASPPLPSPAQFETSAASDEAPAPEKSLSPPMPIAAAKQRSGAVDMMQQADAGHGTALPPEPREAANSAPLADRSEFPAQPRVRHGDGQTAKPGAIVQQPAASPPVESEPAPESVVKAATTAMPAIPTDVWPLDGKQWKRLAATLEGTPERHAEALAVDDRSARAGIMTEIAQDALRRPWRLLAATPEAPEVLALAAFLRQSLPPGEELAVQGDADIPMGFARLVPPERQ
ncbi:MAG: hypothetical protein LBL48_01305 [Azoarcus sp.]|jgi:hypothetical protein|nr:hypothetical protein [Azoarcus sp.]